MRWPQHSTALESRSVQNDATQREGGGMNTESPLCKCGRGD